MFADFMMNAWIAGTVVAIVAPIVGFFVVLRGDSFAAHAIPEAAFAGAAGGALIGISSLVGMGIAALVAGVVIGITVGRLQHDVLTALVMTMLLATGVLFLGWTTGYSQQVFSLLFGEILGVSTSEIAVTVAIGIVVLLVLAVFGRPLLWAALVPEIAQARGLSSARLELVFMVALALVTTAAVPVTGALLMFSLMIGPPATIVQVTKRPGTAITCSMILGLVTVWAAIVAAYQTDWPIGFFVTAISFVMYLFTRAYTAIRQRSERRLRGFPTDSVGDN